jgi:hypothetical protein
MLFGVPCNYLFLPLELSYPNWIFFPLLMEERDMGFFSKFLQRKRNQNYHGASLPLPPFLLLIPHQLTNISLEGEPSPQMQGLS